jgi:anti-sigma factor RsiW
MNDCGNADVRDQLPDLVNGSLAPAARSAVEAHVRACADCAAEVALLQAARGVLRKGAAVDVEAISRAVASARLPSPPARWRAARWTRAAAAAVVVAAAASAAVIGVRRSGLPTASPDAPAPQTMGPAARAEGPRVDAPAVPARGATASDLALAAGVQFLSDAELETLLGDIEELDGVPAEDPQPLLPAILDQGGVL